MAAEAGPRRLRVGVDSGGTFTDVCVFDEASGALHVWKVGSTPGDPSEGIVGGVVEALGDGADAASVVHFGHGTTVATNALIQKRGARTGLLTTAGFRDVLEIRRQTRPDLYDLQTEKPPILVPRDLRLEVRERVLFDGSVAVDLDEAGVRAAARRLRGEGVQAVAVCLLFSFLHPAHEARIRDILAEEFPDAFVSVSHEIAPEFREYERTSTVVVNAYLGPIMRSYIARLRPRLTAAGIGAAPYLTQSNGGVISAEVAQRQPVRTILSGPAAGVMGALALARAARHPNLITFDMGGTSSDVALIEDGEPRMEGSAEVHGYPLKVPMLGIHTVGAGGGSIARIDQGLLKVGPASAGAVPGPACYARGNAEPTVTDANVALGILNQSHLLGGRMPINAAMARLAIARLADGLGITTLAAARGIMRVVVANMAKAVRVISVEKGYDPRDFTMMAFGGAGPIHAALLARELGIPRVLVPKYPGIMCALGLLLSDLRTDFSLTRYVTLDEQALPALAEGFTELDGRAAAWFDEEGLEAGQRGIVHALDMRYGGQGYELTVPWPEAADPTRRLEMLRRHFESAHRQAYGYVADTEPIQVTTLRLQATGRVPKAALTPAPALAGTVADARIGTRTVSLWPEAGDLATPVYDRDRLGPGHVLHGPAIIEQMDATTLLLPGQRAAIDPYLNIVIED